MNFLKQWLGIVEREPIQIIDFKWLHRDLTEKQIVYLEQMISNHRNRGMTICRCDVERVLNMFDCSEVKRK